MSRGTCSSCNHLLACVALGHTPISSATTILDTIRENEDGKYGIDVLMTYV